MMFKNNLYPNLTIFTGVYISVVNASKPVIVGDVGVKNKSAFPAVENKHI